MGREERHARAQPQSCRSGVSALVLAVPTFKSERFLAETLASLNAQGDFVCWHLQDGASPDRTVEIARSFARPGDVIVSEPDSGQPEALNRAMRRMGGEIIGFLNGDDCLAPGAAARVLQFFSEHPEIDILCGTIEWMDEESRVTGTHAGRIESLGEVLDIYGVWWNRRQWVQPEVFFRRSFWERVGGFNPFYDLIFDYDFWVRCFIAGARVAHVPDVFARFRLHANQKSSAAQAAADEIRACVGKHLASRPDIGCWRRVRLASELSYDCYANGTQILVNEPRPTLARSLVRNPAWLLCPPVQQRIAAAVRKRVSLPRR